MSKRRLVIVAVGEKGVRYGRGRQMSIPVVQIVQSSGADTWTLTLDGAVAYFFESRSAFKRIERVFVRIEALRDSLPSICIGLAREIVPRRFDWFGLAKEQIENNYSLENRALERAQGPQSYRQTLEYMEAESGFGPMLEVWR